MNASFFIEFSFFWNFRRCAARIITRTEVSFADTCLQEFYSPIVLIKKKIDFRSLGI